MSRGIKWTSEEITFLMGLPFTDKELLSADWDSISEKVQEISGNKRSANATKAKFKKLNADLAKQYTDKKVETVKETMVEVYNNDWSEEADYFLLVNFYDMSIDEVRSHFGRSYAKCAGRLEQLIDSTELTHIELVSKAATAVRERKQPNIPKGPISAKEKRIINKMVKLQFRLDRLRGGKNE